MIPKIQLVRGKWESGISDGQVLPCGVCGIIPKYEFLVDDDFWREVVAEKDRLGVVCLPCFDELAALKGLDVSEHLIEVQFTGKEQTIILIPTKVYLYPEPEKLIPNTHIGSHTHINHRYNGKR